MKYLLTLLLLLVPLSVTFGADADPVFEVGALTVDGGASHLAYMSGFEMNVKATKTGFTNKIRSGIYQVRTGGEEIQGFYAWNISQQVLKKEWWNLYASFGFGVLNEVKDGDDKQSGGTMIEFGCKAFDKLPIGFGAKLFPVDDKGDKVFLYGMISFSLP